MMLGEKELIKLFPDFADLVQPSGIDLELDDIFQKMLCISKTPVQPITDSNRLKSGLSTAGGEVTAWDVKRIFDMGETGAAEWYFEYQITGADMFSFDGVSLVETEDGKIKKWSEFAQTKDKTYPFEG